MISALYIMKTIGWISVIPGITMQFEQKALLMCMTCFSALRYFEQKGLLMCMTCFSWSSDFHLQDYYMTIHHTWN